MRCLSLTGLRWAMKTGIFILGTLTIMTVVKNKFTEQIDTHQILNLKLSVMHLNWFNQRIDSFYTLHYAIISHLTHIKLGILYKDYFLFRVYFQ